MSILFVANKDYYIKLPNFVSCMSFFGLPTVSELVSQRKNRFQLKCNLLDNLLCNVCQSQ